MDKRYRMGLFYCFDSISESYFEMAGKYNMKLIPIVKSKPLILLTSKKNPLALRKKIEFERIRESAVLCMKILNLRSGWGF